MRDPRLSKPTSVGFNGCVASAIAPALMEPTMNVDPTYDPSAPQRRPCADAKTGDVTPSEMTRRYSPAVFPAPSVQAVLSYLQPTQERPYNYAYQPPPGTPWENYRHDERTVSISDGRAASTRSSIHVEGFALWDAPSTVQDFLDRDTIVEAYYPEVEELARMATGATRAYVFDHLVRRREADRRPLGFGRPDQGAIAAANGQVHNDYTEESGRTRLSLVLGENAAKLGVTRYSIVNVWRSIKAPVLDTPLAVCDARTIGVADLVNAEVRVCATYRRDLSCIALSAASMVLLFRNEPARSAGVQAIRLADQWRCEIHAARGVRSSGRA